jgi:hypothetical protein
MIGLRVTKDMLEYRENILALDDIDIFIMSLNTLIEEFLFAFRGDTERELDLKYFINIINFAKRTGVGLGETASWLVIEFEFPFACKSLLSKRVLVDDINGGLDRLNKLENFDLLTLLSVMYDDQQRIGRLEEVYDLGRSFGGRGAEGVLLAEDAEYRPTLLKAGGAMPDMPRVQPEVPDIPSCEGDEGIPGGELR